MQDHRQYDRGYEDAVEGREVRRPRDCYYLRGYNAGVEFIRDLDTERQQIADEHAEAWADDCAAREQAEYDCER